MGKHTTLLLLILILTSCTSHYIVSEIKWQEVVSSPTPSPTPAKSRQPVQLGIQKALQLALRGNLDYQIMHARVAEAGALVKQADSRFFPRIIAGVRYIHADAPLVFLSTKLDQHKLRFGGNFNQASNFGSGRGYVSLRYGLNTGGAEVFQSILAKLERSIRRREREKVLNGIVTAVVEAYYNVLAAKKAIEIAKEAVKTITQQLKETKVRYKAGSALKTDLLSLEVRLASAKEEVIRAENRYQLLKNALAILLGLGPKTPLEVREEEWNPRPLPKTYQEAIPIALKNRAELQVAKMRYQQARYAKRLAQSQYFPNLEFFADYYFEDRDFRYNIHRDNWMVGVGLSIQIFDGLYTWGKIKEAIAKRKAAYFALRKTFLSIQHEVEAAYLNWKEAKERVKVFELALKQAKENFQLVKKQYEQGAATIVKYLNAELGLRRTQFQLTQARYDLKKAKARVGHALGFCAKCVQ